MTSRAPLAIDLFTGLHGWAEGLVAEGFEVVGFDLEDMCAQFGFPRPPNAQLVLQNVLTLHGSQFRGADLIVASPPCQAYSYRAMPWKRAKALPPPDNTLFEACFRIQREACAAAGRHIPLIVENVRGAQKWVGRARWNYGSFYLWGDVPALMPMTLKRGVMEAGVAHRSNGETNFHGHKNRGLDWSKHAEPDYRTSGAGACFRDTAIKNNGDSWFNVAHNTTSGKGQNPDGRKFTIKKPGDVSRTTRDPVASAHGKTRKFASAMIAKIPLPLARHIARSFLPQRRSIAA